MVSDDAYTGMTAELSYFDERGRRSNATDQGNLHRFGFA